MKLRDYKEIMNLLGYKMTEDEYYYYLKKKDGHDFKDIVVRKNYVGGFSFSMTGFNKNDLHAINFTKSFANTEIADRFKERLEVVLGGENVSRF